MTCIDEVLTNVNELNLSPQQKTKKLTHLFGSSVSEIIQRKSDLLNEDSLKSLFPFLENEQINDIVKKAVNSGCDQVVKSIHESNQNDYGKNIGTQNFHLSNRKRRLQDINQSSLKNEDILNSKESPNFENRKITKISRKRNELTQDNIENFSQNHVINNNIVKRENIPEINKILMIIKNLKSNEEIIKYLRSKITEYVQKCRNIDEDQKNIDTYELENSKYNSLIVSYYKKYLASYKYMVNYQKKNSEIESLKKQIKMQQHKNNDLIEDLKEFDIDVNQFYTDDY